MRIAIVATALMIFAVVVAGSAAEQTATVRGYVLDSACAFTKSLNKPVSRACALACAKGGSPLVILGDDGNIYWPISSATPAAGQNPRLPSLPARRSPATGKSSRRGGPEPSSSKRSRRKPRNSILSRRRSLPALTTSLLGCVMARV